MRRGKPRKAVKAGEGKKEIGILDVDKMLAEGRAGKLRGARKGLLPTFLEPSLATPCEKPPSGPK